MVRMVRTSEAPFVINIISVYKTVKFKLKLANKLIEEVTSLTNHHHFLRLAQTNHNYMYREASCVLAFLCTMHCLITTIYFVYVAWCAVRFLESNNY